MVLPLRLPACRLTCPSFPARFPLQHPCRSPATAACGPRPRPRLGPASAADGSNAQAALHLAVAVTAALVRLLA